jgi:ABC-type sulfate transport system permease subunit
MSTEALLERPKPPATAKNRQALEDPGWVRWGLTSLALVVVGVLVVIPVINIFYEALREGVGTYWKNLFLDPDTRHSIILTLTTVPIALVANIVFGVAAAWAISRFRFPGRTFLIALIDLPFAVSPVVAGLMFVLIFGLQGYFGPFLRKDGYAIMPYLVSLLGVAVFALFFLLFRAGRRRERRGLWSHPLLVVLVGGAAVFGGLFFLQGYFEIWPKNTSLKIIFATPGIVLATAFVTFPFVARELLGDSNRLPGKISGGKIEIAGAILDVPAGDWKDGDTLLAYARPHLMMVHQTKVSPVCLNAMVRKLYPVGPLVRVELTTDAGDTLVVKITQPRHQALNLQPGEAVFVTPGEMAFFHGSTAATSIPIDGKCSDLSLEQNAQLSSS